MATKTSAVCIRLMDWSETSQIAVLLTEAEGKVPAVAKGAKRRYPSAMARYSGGLDVLTAGEAVLRLKPPDRLSNLLEWDLTDAHWHLRRHLRAHRLAMYGADLLHHLLTDREPHPRIYRAFRTYLSRAASAVTLLRFQWAVAAEGGYRPVVERDAETGMALPGEAPTVAFSPSLGGLVADTGAGDRWRVRWGTAEALRRVATEEPLEALDEASVGRANRLLATFFETIAERRLPTRRYVTEEMPG